MRRLRTRRASILLVTFMAITIAALVATGLLLRADGSQDVVAVSLRRTQARALAWSGVQAALAQLADSRAGLLAGADPEVFSEFEISLGSSDGVVRTVQMAPGVHAESEAAKLPLNAVDVVALAKLRGLESGDAASILARRGDGFFSPESAFPDTATEPAAAADVRSDLPFDDAATLPDAARLATVFSFEPELAGPAAAAAWPRSDGEPRLFVGDGWTPALAEAVSAVLSEPDAKLAESCFTVQQPLERTSQVAARLAATGVPREQWGAWLDLFTTNPESFRAGLVDINRASASVLACIPGISAETAERLVSLRSTLDAAARASITWPLESGPLTQDQFLEAVDWFTTRSLQFRVRIEAGLAPADPVDTARDEGLLVPLKGRVVLEAVIDVAGPSPRIAYLRDVTLGAWRRPPATPDPLPDAFSPGQRVAEARAADNADEGAAASDAGADAALTIDADLDVGGLEFTASFDPPSTSVIGDLELERVETGGGIENPAGGGRASAAGQESATPAVRPGPSDNRTGRWTFGRRNR